ncbi:MAG TPA: hypothetical protein VNH84_06535 [Candidatus Saccharimonadales bacterium]|nr:hypothetical protein [Candidatus Saccharimonadales bacterium]
MPNDPDNPNTPMQDLLKAYAQQRRQEAGDQHDLHPATRRMLQDEVRRTHPPAVAPEPRSPLRRWLSRWPALAIGFGCCMLLGLSVWLLETQHNPKPVYVAKQTLAQPAAATAPAADAAPAANVALDDRRDQKLPLAAPAPAPAPTPRVQTEALSLAKSETLRAVEKPAGQPVPAVPPAPPSAPADGVRLSFAEAKKDQPQPAADAAAARTRGVPAVPAAVTTAPAVAQKTEPLLTLNAPRPAENTELRNAVAGAENRRGRYMFLNQVQAAPPAPPNAPTAKAVPFLQQATRAAQNNAVLARFELEQKGSQVRVIDADGSVYDGYFYGDTSQSADAATATAAGLADREKQAPKEKRLENVAAASQRANQANSTNVVNVFNIRVIGTNRTLQEPVELDAILVPQSALPASFNAATSQNARQFQWSARRPITRADPQNANVQLPLQNQAALPTNLSAIQRIQGTLRVGTANQLSVDALRTEP